MSDSTGPATPKPAFAIAMSSLPYRSTAAATARSSSPSRVTSQLTTMAFRPVASISRARSRSRSSRRAASTRSAPSRASSRASAAPIPADAPVISATLPAWVAINRHPDIVVAPLPSGSEDLQVVADHYASAIKLPDLVQQRLLGIWQAYSAGVRAVIQDQQTGLGFLGDLRDLT